MLNVCLSLAFTCLGHERQELYRLYDGMHAVTGWASVYILRGGWRGGEEGVEGEGRYTIPLQLLILWQQMCQSPIPLENQVSIAEC